MIVCICHRVSDRDIARAAASGCASFDELQDTLRVATRCGACRECALDTFHAHRAPAGAAADACGGVMPGAVPVAMPVSRAAVRTACPPQHQAA